MKNVLLTLTLSVSCLAQWIKYQVPGTPRTPDGEPNLSSLTPKAIDGKPDLSGIWRPDYNRARPIPPGVVIVASQGSPSSLQFWRTNAAPIPMTPWAEAIFKERDRAFGAGRPSERCLPHGIPDAMLVTNFKILQHPGVTLILYEEFTRFRQIFTDGRGFPEIKAPAWLGFSIGRWDQDTFVVETRGFNDRTWLDDAGHPHSEDLHTTERFHRRDFGHMDLEITFEDAKAYTEPWSATLHFLLVPDTELIEDVCDNERDDPHLVGRIPSDDVKPPAVNVSLQILSKYVGAYDAKPPVGDPLVIEVSLNGDRLVLLGSELTPVSEIEFSSPFGNIRFIKNAQGEVTGFAGVAEDIQATRRNGPAPKPAQK